MGSLNKVILIGHLGRDAELRYTPGGVAVAKFSLATAKTWTDKSGVKQERTEWHAVDAWAKLGEALAPFLLKGKQVYVEGELQTDDWTDKDGVKRKSTKVRAFHIVLLGSAPRDGRPAHVADEQVGHGEPVTQIEEHEDPIPF